MKKSDIEDVFKKISPVLDREEPTAGHQDRFLEKLQGQNTPATRGVSWWKPLAIAASVALLFGLFLGSLYQNPTADETLAEMGPEVSNTELYFAAVIEEQLTLLQQQDGPEANKIIADAMDQLAFLEADYNQMRTDLLEGGDYKIILSAMVQNFQMRIDLLKDVMQKVESIKNLKEQNDENFTL
ncbi:hypothetical protein [Muriicola soli]|uniref:Anti-sigma factor n=1 Tax=Muriicola soli TaxID=2507538 RepID=A0A411E7S7_9FLAO|nr:hypothetical protein [Muriicola soli]QBA63771.1 hypothetical protein EQY75_03980 [Muriicola soli]